MTQATGRWSAPALAWRQARIMTSRSTASEERPDGAKPREALLNVVTMKFTKSVTNSRLPDRLFAFVPPKGVATVPIETR